MHTDSYWPMKFDMTPMLHAEIQQGSVRGRPIVPPQPFHACVGMNSLSCNFLEKVVDPDKPEWRKYTSGILQYKFLNAKGKMRTFK